MTFSRRFIIGVDPGVSGAIAVIDRFTGELVNVHDMPTTTRIMSKGTKRQIIDPVALGIIVASYAKDVELAVVEDVESRPNDGAIGAFTFGQSKGLILGVLAANMLAVHMVIPAVWKMSMGLSGDKRKSLEKAREMWPSSDMFQRVKDDGRAEAAILASIGRRFTIA